ncbi:hypothetical protein [Larkinella rosea]|uniref:Uncharacterized protein n=1 Tax=Larkinella rosea TaxID=2025312 RepID=A0A3P1BI34_9BACT|nr:hypothetical protein [Larkinella rosea]RRB00721.1 hypothetical protein EHT25_21225 [Larkinella rosea]
MNNRHRQITNVRNRVAEWLLFVTLFCGLFLLWGSFGDSDFRQRPIQIESVASARPGVSSARSVVFKKKPLSVAEKAVLSVHLLFDLCPLLAFNRLEKTRFAIFSKSIAVHKTAHRFLSHKTIPQSSDEEYVTFYRG